MFEETCTLRNKSNYALLGWAALGNFWTVLGRFVKLAGQLKTQATYALCRILHNLDLGVPISGSVLKILMFIRKIM